MNHIYQLKVELKGIVPLIWRRIQVSEDTAFSELHDIIQIAMGWENAHMYDFKFKNIRIYDFQEVIDDGTNPSERDSMDTFLGEIVSGVKSKFTYRYDFGDDWEHTIILEKKLPVDEDKTYPSCVDGERACPSEGCGGIWGYQDMMSILADKNHPEYESTTDWLGEGWNAEVFNIDACNDIMNDYEEQWEMIDEDDDEMTIAFPDSDDEYDEFEYDDNYEYDELKKFTCPEDVLNDEKEGVNIEDRLKNALQLEGSLESQTLERLRKLGCDKKESNSLILEALSIERYYSLKYGIDHLEGRFDYNLQHLPQKPQELPRSKDALAVLNRCQKGVPFAAVEYLQNDISEETTLAILMALKNHSDHQYCWAECTYAPVWYAFAAEGHLCEELIDLVIELNKTNPNESDWLYDQGQYLIGKLAQKYPDLTATKVLVAMESDEGKISMPYIFHMFDAFHFCDINKYKVRLLELLKRDDLSWYDALAIIIADLSIVEGLPILKNKLNILKTDPTLGPESIGFIVDTEKAILILEGPLIPNQVRMKPLCLTRDGSWKDELIEEEASFYEDQDFSDLFDFADRIGSNSDKSLEWPRFPSVKPYIKEETLGRNDPCSCGSGKKYKKCCMN